MARVICPPGIPAAPVCGCVGWHNLVISPVLVMKARWRGMWQCDNVGAVWLQSSSLRPRPVWRGGGVLQSSRDMQSLHSDTSHTQHFCLPYLPWDFVHWGWGGFLVSGLFNIKTLVSCPSRVEDQIRLMKWMMIVNFSMVKVWPRCGLMLMWLLLTAGTFDTICPWTI